MTEAVRRGRILAEAATTARDLVNEPGNTLTPTELARRAQAMARAARVRCEVLGPRELRRLGAGALLGVARGSQEPPRLIVLTYRGRRSGPHLGMVGKGVTFDSGGISIKPAENMEAMKGDMAGAAATIAATCAIARLGLPVRVTAVVPATENLPSGSALKPGDVLRALSGTTIEVINTDAEGRLILADALAFARKRQVTHLVDAATLTGACVVALGTINSGAFTNDQAWLETVLAAGRASGERIWPMPMDVEYDELIKSDIAEIKNTGGRKGGLHRSQIPAALRRGNALGAPGHRRNVGVGQGKRLPRQGRDGRDGANLRSPRDGDVGEMTAVSNQCSATADSLRG